MTISIKVLLFASAREAAGNISEVSISIEEGEGGDGDSPVLPNTTMFRKLMAEKYPKLAKMVLDEDSLTLALNEEYVPYGEVKELHNGDTIALIPPISGG